MAKQKLSPQGLKAKKERDLAYANSPFRKELRADSQKKRREAIKAGKSVNGKDYDHNTGKFVSVKYNRGGTQKSGTDGTKAESRKSRKK